jgi:hypothetical protein
MTAAERAALLAELLAERYGTAPDLERERAVR